MPPPAQCLSWVGELEGIFARELLLKTALVDGISHDAEHTQQAPYCLLLVVVVVAVAVVAVIAAILLLSTLLL